MPLLLCPNDNGAMQTVQRSGVEFDICPTCRGVWLDRGELDKIIARSSSAPSRDLPREREPERRRYDDDDRKPYKKKRENFLEELFDF